MNTEDMKNYLQGYDVLKQKYFWDIDASLITGEVMDQAVALERRVKSADMYQTVEKAQDAYLTVQKIYDKGMNENLGLLQMVLEKFLGDFVGINGLGNLFDSSYFNFEWLLHLEYNSEKHDYTYYRDHYMHQIRNMYEMLVLLDKYGFMEYCIESYQRNGNLIAEQIRDSVDRQIDRAGAAGKVFARKILSIKKSPETENEAGRRMRECYYRYLIHAVAMITSLVHDIGYPLAYMLRTTENLHRFLPFSVEFIHLDDAVPHLRMTLQESLLYQTVDGAKIEKRIKEKKDHGALSAVLLLSKYYETGLIYRLDPIQKMAIELSAVAIYNHTLKYGKMTGEEEEQYHNMFCDNPISYLFRLCDDLQEWDRVYFEIGNKSNFLVCEKCRMPITRMEEKDGIQPYSCGCGDMGMRMTRFPYKKLSNISACKALVIKEMGSSPKELLFEFRYDLESLLQLSYYNPTYIKYRADGVYEIKRMLDGQEKLPGMFAEAFVSNNPIAIKVRCLEAYLMQKKKADRKDVWKDIMDDFKTWKDAQPDQTVIQDGIWVYWLTRHDGNAADKDSKFETLLSDLKLQKPSESAVCCKWIVNLEFYRCLSAIGIWIETERESGGFADRQETLRFAERMAEKAAGHYGIKDRPTKVLLMDYFWLRVREVSAAEFSRNKSKYYYEASLSNKYITDTVEEYVESEQYNKVKEAIQRGTSGGLDGIYDFFTDYELFAAMARYVAKKR